MLHDAPSSAYLEDQQPGSAASRSALRRIVVQFGPPVGLVALLLVAIAALYIASVWASFDAGMPLLSVALAVVTFGISYWGSVTWQRVFVREMQEA